MSYCPLFKIHFPDFSRLCFHISGWNLVHVASFFMKSYRSSLTFATVDLLFQELLPFAQNSFSGLFSAMLSNVVSKLIHVELQIEFYFRHGWPFFTSYCPLFKICFPDFSCLLKSEPKNGCRFQFVGVGGDLYCFSNTLGVLVLQLFHSDIHKI